MDLEIVVDLNLETVVD